MPQTPNSTTVSYVTPADFLLRYDARVAGDLVSDTNSQQSPSALNGNPQLLAALFDATGMFEQAAYAGNRYTPDDMAALMATTSAGSSYVKRIVSTIAAYTLLLRRWTIPDASQQAYDAAMKVLDQLRDGQRILPFLESEEAGVTETAIYTQQEIQNLYLSTSKQRIYGNTRVQDRIGYGTGGWN